MLSNPRENELEILTAIAAHEEARMGRFRNSLPEGMQERYIEWEKTRSRLIESFQRAFLYTSPRESLERQEVCQYVTRNLYRHIEEGVLWHKLLQDFFARDLPPSITLAVPLAELLGNGSVDALKAIPNTSFADANYGPPPCPYCYCPLNSPQCQKSHP